MAWVAVDKNGSECIFEKKPFRLRKQWMIPISFKNEEYCGFSDLPKGSIEKLIGKKLTWDDSPVELKEEQLWLSINFVQTQILKN